MKKKKNTKEISPGIYIIDQKKTTTPKENSKTVYTLLGNQTILKDGYPIIAGKNAETKDTAYAKHEVNNGRSSYFVKISDNDELYNPISIGPLNTHKKFKLLKTEKMWQFSKVNAECFKSYIEFLKTKNVLHLKFAERQR